MKAPRAIRAIVVVAACLGLLYALCGPHGPGWRHAVESARRGTCLRNLVQLGVGMKQYSENFGDVFPWRVGASSPEDGWRDLGLLYPEYVSKPDHFFCRSSGDQRSQVERSFFREVRGLRRQGRGDLLPIPSVGSRVVISYSYSRNASSTAADRMATAARPWTEKDKSTVRLLADKKAGLVKTEKAAHGTNGRNVLYKDGHVKWKPSDIAVDPDEESDTIGAPDAPDYRAWWSDPPYYGEGTQ